MSFIQKIIDVGVKPETEFYQKREVRILNIVSFLTVMGALVGLTNLFILEEVYPIAIQFFVLTYSGLIIILNHLQKFKYTVWIFVFGISLTLLYVGEYYDVSTACHMFYYPVIFCVALLHNPERSNYRTIAFFGIIVLSFFVSQVFTFHVNQDVTFTAEQNKILFYYNIFTCIILTLVLVYIMITLINRQHDEVLDLLKKVNEDKVVIEHSLSEKEVLIAEIQHRVKNNMAVIIGLFNMQKHQAINEETREALTEAKNRVLSISMVHESLYRKKDLSKINLSNYLSSLCKEIIHVHPLHDKIKLEEEIDLIETDITKAVPLGLIVNECITNSMKHAFQKKEIAPTIFISLKHQFGNVVLKIGDNGIGFDEKTVKKDSLGLSLINSLTEQLDGTTHFANSSNGSNIKITFPA